MKIFLQSIRPGNEDKRFAVLSYDPETKKGIVQGSMGTQFETDMSKEKLVQYGYKVVQEE